MAENKDTQLKIEQLQILEQNIQNFSMQKQQFQSQGIELDNALAELKKPTEKVYKIIGNIMVASEKENVKKELEGKKEVINLRINAVDKQTNQLKEKASKLQQEVLEKLKEK